MMFTKINIFGFEYKVKLGQQFFNNVKYEFSILKVIDGRLNRQKPIGSVAAGFSQKNELIGNDSLGYQMSIFFRNKAEIFDSTEKILLVLNQCNLSRAQGNSFFTGQIDDLETTVAFDYYRIVGNKYELIYQQYFKHIESVKFIAKIGQGIDMAFSETVKFALWDFNKQVKLKNFFTGEPLTSDSLFNFFNCIQKQAITRQNIKNGLYFSCKDLYLNKPGVTNDVSFDTSALGKKPLSIKSKKFIVEKCYAIVAHKQIFIYTSKNNYKAALISEDGDLYFPDVTKSSISKAASSGSAVVGIIGSFLPFGFLGSVAKDVIRSGIEESGSSRATVDVIVDLETGDLNYKK